MGLVIQSLALTLVYKRELLYGQGFLPQILGFYAPQDSVTDVSLIENRINEIVSFIMISPENI